MPKYLWSLSMMGSGCGDSAVVCWERMWKRGEEACTYSIMEGEAETEAYSGVSSYGLCSLKLNPRLCFAERHGYISSADRVLG
ncbi:hypothetical protein E2C01_094064 [Portunus trituberculatus]|uniref:Uncharacterized protein n=1 Tax=Portunus trituberculatus TaxID=210409 RepID=A0A5B7K243_PORTR|nr:hypothetical protein [Portunus trituberculatus]